MYLDCYYNTKFCYFVKSLIVMNVPKVVLFLIVIYYVRSGSTKIKCLILMLVQKPNFLIIFYKTKYILPAFI